MVDAFAHLGVTDMTMPHTSYRVWQQLVDGRVVRRGEAQTFVTIKIGADK